MSVDESGNLQAYVQNVAQRSTASGIKKFSESDNFQRIAAHAADKGRKQGWVR